MVFELERFLAVWTFEFPENSALVVADHVPLETIDVRECLVANLARLKKLNKLTCRADQSNYRNIAFLFFFSLADDKRSQTECLTYNLGELSVDIVLVDAGERSFVRVLDVELENV